LGCTSGLSQGAGFPSAIAYFKLIDILIKLKVSRNLLSMT
jgi:hypothetical protein